MYLQAVTQLLVGMFTKGRVTMCPDFASRDSLCITPIVPGLRIILFSLSKVFLFVRNSLTDIENRLVLAKRKGRVGRKDWRVWN